jgi:hypothetical protein
MINRTDRQCNECYKPLCEMDDECARIMKSKWIDAAQKEAGKTNYQNEITHIYTGASLPDWVKQLN